MKVRMILFLTVMGMVIFLNGCGEKQTKDTVTDEQNKETEETMAEEDKTGAGSNETNNSNEVNNSNETSNSNEVNNSNGTSNSNEGNNSNGTSNSNETSNGSEGNNSNETNNSNGTSNSNEGNNSNENPAGDGNAEDDVDKKAEANQNAVVQAGYYKIVSASDGGYMVMVHNGEYAYGIGLLQEYLANLGYHAPNGMGGGWINADQDQYMCYVRGEAIVPLLTEEDEEFWD